MHKRVFMLNIFVFFFGFIVVVCFSCCSFCPILISVALLNVLFAAALSHFDVDLFAIVFRNLLDLHYLNGAVL